MIRNIVSLDQTLAVFIPDFKAERGVRQKIIGSMIRINQSVVPVDPKKTQLTKSLSTRRQRLFGAIFHELVEVLGEDYVRMVHVLPHFQAKLFPSSNGDGSWC